MPAGTAPSDALADPAGIDDDVLRDACGTRGRPGDRRRRRRRWTSRTDRRRARRAGRASSGWRAPDGRRPRRPRPGSTPAPSPARLARPGGVRREDDVLAIRQRDPDRRARFSRTVERAPTGLASATAGRTGRLDDDTEILTPGRIPKADDGRMPKQIEIAAGDRRRRRSPERRSSYPGPRAGPARPAVADLRRCTAAGSIATRHGRSTSSASPPGSSAVHPRTLRIYEDEGLLCPARTPTNIRLYSEERHPPDPVDPPPDPGPRREPRRRPDPVRARGAPRRPHPRGALRRRDPCGREDAPRRRGRRRRRDPDGPTAHDGPDGDRPACPPPADHDHRPSTPRTRRAGPAPGRHSQGDPDGQATVQAGGRSQASRPSRATASCRSSPCGRRSSSRR